ncbi:hypothetical protein [Vibrio scophthalmi]|uniref:Uncharacterized protein n=1 Tax=Vibrio scophthalmi TaxID=45658 RepID=A0A1E3WFA1_9VIBR|nr:hypothetical protein [Vibrio scophthalmi]ODS04456.1 hypothetical protein VSF3289_03595 [Vibrio scophthalmi]
MKPAYLQSELEVKYNQRLCFLCEKNNSYIYVFNSKCLCESCIDIAHGLITNRMVKPTSDIESELFSLLFVLEREMEFTRYTLNKTSELSEIQEMLKSNIEIIDALPRTFTDVSETLINQYIDKINQYKTMLQLFIC